MKREIKFRGYSALLKGWVYGDLVINKPTQCHRIVSDFSLVTLAGFLEDGLNRCGGEFYIIDAKSVGEFTGLLDKNGKEIYEGDIVNTSYEIMSTENGKDFYGSGLWKHEFNKLVEYKHGAFWAGSLLKGKQIEVVGNIYEHPELLKQEQ